MQSDSAVFIDEMVASADAGAMAATVGRLATLLADGHADIKEVTEVVTYDQALTAALLRRANSSADGGSVPTTTVKDAAVRLGANTLLSMAVAAMVDGQMKASMPAYGLVDGEMWRRSVAASVASEVIRAQATVDVPGEASTAGLLHDFGKVVISRHMGEGLFTMLDVAARNEGLSLLDAERAVLGIDHTEVGGLVAKRWRLPLSIVSAIHDHHHTAAGQSPICATVSLAHGMIDDVLAGVDEQTGDVIGTHQAVFASLGLDPYRYHQLLGAVRHRYEAVAGNFGISAEEVRGGAGSPDGAAIPLQGDTTTPPSSRRRWRG